MGGDSGWSQCNELHQQFSEKNSMASSSSTLTDDFSASILAVSPLRTPMRYK